MLGDICANSDADISFDKMTFTVTGSDDAVKDALRVLAQIKFVNQTQHQIRVKIELANEHKEFVSGKKNGKINKIMTQSKSWRPTSWFRNKLTVWCRQCPDHL
jgi:hypothetical protein